MDESDLDHGFQEGFDEVIRKSLSSSQSRFFNRSPIKETAHEDDLRDQMRHLNIGAQHNKTLSRDDYVEGFDELDQGTIKASNFATLRQPSRKKSLRFLEMYKNESDIEDDIDFANLNASSPSRRHRHERGERPDEIQLSPSRSTSSSISLNEFSESTDNTDDDNGFTDGFEINNNINLLKQYQARKQRALQQAQIEYDHAMKYNSLLHRKVQSSNNIPRYLKVPNEEDENFMDGFDPISSTSFHRPKRPDAHAARNRMRHSQSSYTLKGKASVPALRNFDAAPRKLKHSASNYFDVYHRSTQDYQAPLFQNNNNYNTVKKYEGDELDHLEDLTEIQDETLTQRDRKSIRKLIDLANYMEVYQDAPSRHQRRRKSSPAKKKRQGKMGLIKQLSSANAEKVYHDKNNGDMKYNPHTYRWEGNEVDLGKFESAAGQKPMMSSNSLHTITKKEQDQKYQIVGNMIFNPEKMCWIPLGGGGTTDDAEDDDPFKGLDDLVEDPVPRNLSHNSSTRRHKQIHNPTARGASSSTVMTTSTIGERLGNIDEEGGPDNETNADPFNLPRDLIYKFKHEEAKWNKKVKNWFQPDEVYDRDYAYEIKRMVSDNA